MHYLNIVTFGKQCFLALLAQWNRYGILCRFINNLKRLFNILSIFNPPSQHHSSRKMNYACTCLLLFYLLSTAPPDHTCSPQLHHLPPISTRPHVPRTKQVLGITFHAACTSVVGLHSEIYISLSSTSHAAAPVKRSTPS